MANLVLIILLVWSGEGCSAWKDKVTYYATWWHYGDLALQKVVFLDKPWKGAQLTQLHELRWAEEKSCEKSRKVQGFLFDQGQKVKV